VDPLKPLSQHWSSPRALMLVHGVGDYHPGDYDDLLQSLAEVLGPELWHSIAVYPVFYDGINDWFVEKTQLKAGVQAISKAVSDRLGASGNSGGIADAFSEGAADVLWPALVRDARLAIRDNLIAQIQQVVIDGRASGIPRWHQQITIICHSLGCIHTYEAIHAAAEVPDYKLRPVTDWVRFANVVMFASPVQLYQSVALSAPVRPFIPDPDEMATLRPLSMPGQPDMSQRFVRSVRNWISVTGAYDPVGGYLLGKQLGWAYMDIQPRPEGFTPIIDPQTDLPFAKAPDELTRVLKSSLVGASGPKIPLQNPHSWTRYVSKNPDVVRQCFA
jgi:hypothetical protein